MKEEALRIKIKNILEADWAGIDVKIKRVVKLIQAERFIVVREYDKKVKQALAEAGGKYPKVQA